MNNLYECKSCGCMLGYFLVRCPNCESYNVGKYGGIIGMFAKDEQGVS